MIKHLFFTFALLITFQISLFSQPSGTDFEYIGTKEAGFNASRLQELSDFLEEAGSSSMLILVDGKIAFEWGDISKKHTIHSIRKAMLNSLYGIAVHEGIIDTNQTIAELNIDDIHPLSEQEKSARIADILKSRSGVYHPAAAVSEGMMYGKPERDTYKPGEHYYYNNWDFNVLAHILEVKTGKTIYELFYEKIAQPLGTKDFKGTYTSIDLEEIESEDEFGFPQTDGFYQYEMNKSKYPAYHFRMSARDMALYGQLYLQNGKWEGEQIIPESWIEASTKPYSLYNPGYGIAYGMLWYVLVPTEDRSTTSFYHTGTGVHMLGIYPASNLVLIHRVDTEKEYTFSQENFYQMISLVWGARIDS